MLNYFLITCSWYLILTCIGVIVLPISMIVFRRMPDGGILLSRPLGWMLLGFFTWYLAYLRLLPNNLFGLLVLCLLFFLFSLYLMKRRKEWTLRKLKAHWRTALNGEILTIIAFLLIAQVRYYDPNIDATEKPMDAMMLNSALHSTWMPPQDAWFAGEHINYHYGGYILHTIPLRLSGFDTAVGYNLAVATVAAIGASVAFVLGRALFGLCRWGALSVICTLFIGNIAAFFQMMMSWFPNNLYEWRNGFLWKTSRVIVDKGGETINEYPLFSILWGDLHPHFSNIPFVLFFLALGYALYKSLWRHPIKHILRYERLLVISTFLSLILLFPTNVFDFPIASLIYGFLVVGVIANLLLYHPGDRAQTLKKGLLVFMPIAAYLFAFPFWLHFESPLQENPVRWAEDHTQLFQMFLVFGAPLVCTLVFLILKARKFAEDHYDDEMKFIALLGGLLFILLWSVSGNVSYALTPVLALWLWGLVVSLAVRKQQTDRSQSEYFALVLVAVGWSLIAGCEYLFLKDNYGIARMNTLFKFHFPAWLLFGIGLPPLLFYAIKECKDTFAKGFALFFVLGALFVSIIGGSFLLLGVYTLPANSKAKTFDGIAFLKAHNSTQYEMIEWIQNNAGKRDRILELPGCGYRLENIVSAFTGRPTVLGWINHEGLWRAHPPEINQRRNEVAQFFTTQDWQSAKAILQKYDIRYVAYTPPICEEFKPYIGQIAQAAFRNNLERIIPSTNIGFSSELYRVPEEIYAANQE